MTQQALGARNPQSTANAEGLVPEGVGREMGSGQRDWAASADAARPGRLRALMRLQEPR